MEKSSVKDFFGFMGNSGDDSIAKLREKTARKLFIFFALLFFLSYFFIGVSFYSNFFEIIISKIFILFLFSGTIFLFLLVSNNIKNLLGKYFLLGIIILLFIIALLPFFISLK